MLPVLFSSQQFQKVEIHLQTSVGTLHQYGIFQSTYTYTYDEKAFWNALVSPSPLLIYLSGRPNITFLHLSLPPIPHCWNCCSSGFSFKISKNTICRKVFGIILCIIIWMTGNKHYVFAQFYIIDPELPGICQP